MPRFPFRSLAASLPLCLATHAVSAQLIVKPQSIQVQGEQQYSVNEIAQAAGVEIGHEYTADALSQTAQKLMGTGLFEKVGFKFDGQVLTYLISDNPTLYTVEIGNLPLPPDENLDEELRAKVPLYRGKVASDGTVFDGVRQSLQSILAKEGVQATVVAVPDGDNPGKKATAMSFLINAPAVKIGEIQLDGIRAGIQSGIPKPVLLAKADYSNDRSASEIQDFYRAALAKLGYAAATVRVRRAGDPQVSSDSIKVPFTVDVTPGRVYKLGEVSLAPGMPITLKQIESDIKPRSGYSPENAYVGAVVAEVIQQLKSMGYLDCIVNSHSTIDEPAGTVNYTIDATTGPIYHLAFVKFENVSDQLRSLLMRNWQMMPGDPFNEIYVSNFIQNEQKSSPVLMRTLAGVKADFNVKADPETHDVNLVIRLER